MSHVPPRRGKRKGTLSALNDQNAQAQRMKKNRGRDDGAKDDVIEVTWTPHLFNWGYGSFGKSSLAWSFCDEIGASKREPPKPLDLAVSQQLGGIHAFRCWHLGTDDAGPVLESMVVGRGDFLLFGPRNPSKPFRWAGPVTRAEATPHNGMISRDPHVGWHDGVKGPEMGLFAAKSFTPLDYREAHVYGEVLLFGRVVVHEHGYRAEKAMIRRLVVVDHFALLKMPSLPDLLARRYGCEVSTDIRSLLTEA